MFRSFLTFGLALVTLTVGMAQDKSNKTYILYSWKDGTAKVQELELWFDLDVEGEAVVRGIRDSTGQDKYCLTIISRKGGYPGWNLSLVDKTVRGEANLLERAANDGFLPDPQDRLAELVYIRPLKDGDFVRVVSVPLLDQRIVKVEDFYCIIQVLSYTVTRSKNYEVVQSARLRVQFKNAAPVEFR